MIQSLLFSAKMEMFCFKQALFKGYSLFSVIITRDERQIYEYDGLKSFTCDKISNIY